MGMTAITRTCFQVFGPFELAIATRNGGRIICRETVRAKLQVDAEAAWPGMNIPSKRGCYVFAVRSGGRSSKGGAYRPWYVGKTGRQSLLVESTSSDKLVKYQDAMLRTKIGTPVLFFVAKPSPGKVRSIDQQVLASMERALIAAAHRANTELLNCHNRPSHAFYIKGVPIPDRTQAGRPSQVEVTFASMLACSL
jgi:hypothetical protein